MSKVDVDMGGVEPETPLVDPPAELQVKTLRKTSTCMLHQIDPPDGSKTKRIKNNELKAFLLSFIKLTDTWPDQQSSDVASLRSSVESATESITTSLKELIHQQHATAKLTTTALSKIPSAPTYAQAAAWSAHKPYATPSSLSYPSFASVTPAAPAEARPEDCDVTVHRPNHQSKDHPEPHKNLAAEAQHFSMMINKELMKSNNKIVKSIRVGAVRILPSGDIRITAHKPRDAELLRLHIMDSQGEIQRPVYGILINSVPKKQDTAEIDVVRTIEAFRNANPETLRDAEILRVHWILKLRENKKSSTMVLEFGSPVDANRVICAEYLFWEYQTRKTRKFIRNCQIT